MHKGITPMPRTDASWPPEDRAVYEAARLIRARIRRSAELFRAHSDSRGRFDLPAILAAMDEDAAINGQRNRK